MPIERFRCTHMMHRIAPAAAGETTKAGVRTRYRSPIGFSYSRSLEYAKISSAPVKKTAHAHEGERARAREVRQRIKFEHTRAATHSNSTSG